MFRLYLQDKVAQVTYKEITDKGDIILGNEASESEYTFWFSKPKGKREIEGKAALKELSNEKSRRIYRCIYRHVCLGKWKSEC